MEEIQADVRWLGFDWGDRPRHASDYFESLFDYAVRLIESGNAYVCSLGARGDPRLPGHPDRARARQPLSDSDEGGEHRSLRAHASRRVRGGRPRAAGEDRHGLTQHEPPRPRDLPDRAHASSDDRPHLVRLSHVRLRTGAVGCHRGRDPLAVHARVRRSSSALRMVPRGAGDSLSATPDRVRPTEPDPYRHEQALPDPAGGEWTCRRMGRSTHADPCRDAATGVHAGGAARLLRACRSDQERWRGGVRAAGDVHPSRSGSKDSTCDGGAAAAQARHRELSAGRFRDVRGSEPPRRPVVGHASGTVLARAVHRERRFHGGTRRASSSDSPRAARSGCATPVS